MNETNAKTEESLKEVPEVVESLAITSVGKNEADTLARDEAPVVADLTNDVPIVDTGDTNGSEEPAHCDEQAKEDNVGKLEILVEEQPEDIQESSSKENTSSPKIYQADLTNLIEADQVKSPIESDTGVSDPRVELKPEIPIETSNHEISSKILPKLEKEPSPPKTLESNRNSVQDDKTMEVDTSQIVEEKKLETIEDKVQSPELQPEIENIKMETKDSKLEEKIEPKVEFKATPPLNGDVSKDEHSRKRRASDELDTESPLKKLSQEVEKNFTHHDVMINEYIQTATKNNVDEIQRHTEQLLSEIQTLRGLAQKKEHEWNNILHLKKVKEEILLRLLRKKQVLSFEKAVELNGADRTDPYDYLNPSKSLAIDKSDEISGLAIKQPMPMVNPMMQGPMMPVTSHFSHLTGLPPPYDKPHMQGMPEPVFPHQSLMMPGHLQGFPRDMNGQLPNSFGMPMGRQGPTKDVKSIIADYRQRNPSVTPRRGRRMKSVMSPNPMNPRPIAPKLDNMNSLNSLNNLNMLFNNLDMNQKAMLERLQQMQAGALPNGLSFKNALVQFANMQQNAGLLPNRPPEMGSRPEHLRPDRRPSRPEPSHEELHMQQTKQAERLASPSPRLPPPPPYPEISLLPVTTATETATTQQNSLLHGILTKQTSPATQGFSPTLAKLLTSPEKKQSNALPTFGQAKNCGEITITPVQPTPPPAEPQQEKPEDVVQLDDEESPASEASPAASPGGGAGRLVIDEAGGAGGAAGGAGGAGSPAPLCQGCRRRDAQFVCAGCANQWYCSRDCQVAAWDDHSEMCSG